ncbi:DUF5405 family protein, partial [Escherichia coli]|nr:DUF5405 family protein [Escherichia coli]
KKRAESGKNAGQEWLAVFGYYPKLSQLVSGLMHHDILTGSAKSFADLNAQVEQLSRRCSEAFGSYGRYSLRAFCPSFSICCRHR